MLINKLKGTELLMQQINLAVKTRGWTKEYAQQYQLNGLLGYVKKHQLIKG